MELQIENCMTAQVKNDGIGEVGYQNVI